MLYHTPVSLSKGQGDAICSAGDADELQGCGGIYIFTYLGQNVPENLIGIYVICSIVITEKQQCLLHIWFEVNLGVFVSAMNLMPNAHVHGCGIPQDVIRVRWRIGHVLAKFLPRALENRQYV